MALNRADVINRSLVRIGALPRQVADLQLDSEDLVMTYEQRVANTLTVFPWKETVKRLQLVRGEVPDACDYDYAYLLPSDCAGHPLEAWSSAACAEHDRLKLYELGLDKQHRLAILTDAAVVVAAYQKLTPPSLWSPPLLELVIQDLMSAYALQVRQDRTQMIELYELAWGSTERNAQGQFHKAKQMQSARSPSKVITLEDGPLVRARS